MKPICKPDVVHCENNEYPWNVQLLYSYNGGVTFTYCGEGKFFREYGEEMKAYIEEHES